MNGITNILLIILCYLIGSIPTAFLMFKWSQKGDITQEGSGNVGATNLYDLTRSRKLYMYAMIIDLLKGALPILIAIKVFDYHGFYLFIFGLALVFGHNYSIFIKLKGGKGLATAAGVLFVLFPLAVPVWLMLYFVSKRLINDDVHISTLVALFVLPLFVLSTPRVVIEYFLNLTHNVVVDYWEFILFSVMLVLIIASKHYKNIKEKIQQKLKESKELKEKQNA